ncbi:hypothetical protein BD410DRAFT_788623 [Rickenella mellea]|uniref:PCI domain-containing protein n=1 Tax=Rickenella mellea TaxID=50990 RepID=A0A4Y7Q5B6_9AGAM|nr:hypothetical protein BD410DRAFT_788623 [Rickenella mellea]
MSTELASNATAKLEPFLLMSKSAKGAAAAKLVENATSAPGVFVFAELLELPNIQELAKGDHAQYFTLLQLFSYGTYEGYLKSKDSLPALNASQITKLKHLSLVSLAMDRRVLPYARLMQSLQMPTVRELEDLIIDAIYLDLLRGKLDQKKQQFEVEYTLGRDLEPGKLESLLSALQDWAKTTASVLTTLDDKLSTLASEKEVAKSHLNEHELQYAANLKDVADKLKDSARHGRFGGGPSTRAMMGGRSAYDDAMDIDDFPPRDDGKGRSRKPPSTQGDATKGLRLKRNRFL